MNPDPNADFFKILRRDRNGDLVSWITVIPYRILYFPDRAIRAIDGTLGCMAFDSLDAGYKAVTFLHPSEEIWSCRLTNPYIPNWILNLAAGANYLQPLDSLLDSSKPLTLRDLCERERLDWMLERVGHAAKPPLTGTVCGDTLRLMERIR